MNDRKPRRYFHRNRTPPPGLAAVDCSQRHSRHPCFPPRSATSRASNVPSHVSSATARDPSTARRYCAEHSASCPAHPFAHRSPTCSASAPLISKHAAVSTARLSSLSAGRMSTAALKRPPSTGVARLDWLAAMVTRDDHRSCTGCEASTYRCAAAIAACSTALRSAAASSKRSNMPGC